MICIAECQYNRDRPYDRVKHEDDDDDEVLDNDDDGARGGGRDTEGSGSSRRSSLGGDAEYAQKVHRLQTAKQKLRQLQELVAMVQVSARMKKILLTCFLLTGNDFVTFDIIIE